MNEVEIGGQLVPQQAFEAVTQIPSNKTLLVQKLTSQPEKPAPVKGLKTVGEVFDYFKPAVSVEFENEEGTPVEEKLEFRNVGDFTRKGLTAQSGFLQHLKQQHDNYLNISRRLKTNKIFQSALKNPEAKKAYLETLKALIDEIEQTNT